MAIVKSFRGYRPVKEIAKDLACRPYDVLSSEEAREEVKKNPQSFLHVVKAEVDLPEGIDIHTEAVYNKAKENLNSLVKDRILIKDEEPYLYIYAQTMDGRTQYGLVACASVEDYLNKIIKVHELTRPDKEEDRKNHIRYTNFQAEPVFFAYPDHPDINKIVDSVISQPPEYDFVSDDNIGHHFWVIKNQDIIRRIELIFKNEIPFTYIADGHHRTASAANVCKERKFKNPNHTGSEEYNFFMAVHFPASQLKILDYNRVIKDLNGNTTNHLIEKLSKSFVIENKGSVKYKPEKLHNFSMYIDNTWYKLEAKPGTFKECDCIDVLDVTILTKQILEPVFEIKDLRTSTRIEFVGGIRGISELKKRVDSGEMKVAFALYPVSMKQLFDIADTGNIMPPKTTWFEPKLRSGLVIHDME